LQNFENIGDLSEMDYLKLVMTSLNLLVYLKKSGLDY